MKKLAWMIGLTALAAACSRETNVTPATTSGASSAVPTGASASAATSAASRGPTLPPELVKLAGKDKLVAGPFAWPPGGTSAVVLGEDARLIWHDASGEGDDRLPRHATRAEVKDVDKDGAAELVVVADGAPTSPTDPYGVWVYGMNPKTKKATRMPVIELRALGATDAASVERELALPGLGPLTAPPARLIARLPLATPDELKALVGPTGVKTCTRLAEKKNCTPVAQKQIDAAKVRVIAKIGGTISPWEIDGLDPSDALEAPSCSDDEKNPKLVRCGASVGGPAGGEWVFEKTGNGAGLRLAEVWSWAETS